MVYERAQRLGPERFGRQPGQLRLGVGEQAVDRLPQSALRLMERRGLVFETGVVMLQPRPVQPVDLRDPPDPYLAPAGSAAHGRQHSR